MMNYKNLPINFATVVLLAFIGSYVARRYNPATSAMATMNI